MNVKLDRFLQVGRSSHVVSRPAGMPICSTSEFSAKRNVDFWRCFRRFMGSHNCPVRQFPGCDRLLNAFFERLGKMKLVRSLSTLVLMACVTILFGCTANESTSGGGGGGGVGSAGSGVAGGAVAPHSHDAEDGHSHDGEAPDAHPAVDPAAPPADATAPVDPAAPAADPAAPPTDPAAPAADPAAPPTDPAAPPAN